jgi:hypothetical protein
MQNENTVKKAPHYFLVHFTETFTSIQGSMASGKAYVIWCDNVSTNVYGFKSEDEAKAFDPLKLRSLLRGCREQKELWDAPDEETLLLQISADQRIKDKVYELNHHALYGAIENLPECKRMYIDDHEGLLCGRPENQYNDGCLGGCVLAGYDQDSDMPDGFKCPMHEYWENRLRERRKIAS